jgi:hypothetical protein
MGILAQGRAAKEEERAEVIKTAAAVRSVTRQSTSLRRRTRGGGVFGAASSQETGPTGSTGAIRAAAAEVGDPTEVVTDKIDPSADGGGGGDCDGDGNEASRGSPGVGAYAAALRLLHRAVHWAPFPAEATRRFFRESSQARAALLAVSVVATAMVIGDGVLTPAISVVSAVSGLTIKTSISQEGVIGVSVAILVCLFAMQSFGTQRVAFLFSPVIVLWMA